MAGTLGSTVCVRCGGTIKLIESPHRVSDPRKTTHCSHFDFLDVAWAVCLICLTRYIAILRHDHVKDLVYQSTFSDVPGDSDTPFDVQVFVADNVQAKSKIIQPAGGQGMVVTIQNIRTIVVTPRQ